MSEYVTLPQGLDVPLPPLPEHLVGSIIYDHVRIAMLRLLKEHPEEFRKHILTVAMESYAAERDAAEETVERAMDAYGEFAEELGLLP